MHLLKNIVFLLTFLISVLMYMCTHSQLDKADTEDSIDATVDKPSMMMIINSSRWSVIETITKNNKDALLQQLTLKEVVIRREASILAFQRGMHVLGVSQLIRCYPTLMRPLLVAEEKMLTSEQFMSFIGSLKPSQPAELLAYNRFVELITYIGGIFICLVLLLI